MDIIKPYLIRIPRKMKLVSKVIMEKMLKNKGILFVVALIIGIFIYNSPSEAPWLTQNSQDAIKIGRICAYSLLLGNKENLLNMAVGDVKNQIEKTDFKSISRENLMKKMSIGDIKNKIEKTDFGHISRENLMKKLHSLDREILGYVSENMIAVIEPLFVKQNDQNMELVALEQLDGCVVMTFAYKGNRNEIVEIPNKGKLLFSVAVRYCIPVPKSFLGGWWLSVSAVRKVANLPILRYFTGRLGTSKRWMLYKYSYKYDLNDYFDWAARAVEFDNEISTYFYGLSYAYDIEISTHELNNMFNSLALINKWIDSNLQGREDGLSSLGSGKFWDDFRDDVNKYNKFLDKWSGEEVLKQYSRVEKTFETAETNTPNFFNSFPRWRDALESMRSTLSRVTEILGENKISNDNTKQRRGQLK